MKEKLVVIVPRLSVERTVAYHTHPDFSIQNAFLSDKFNNENVQNMTLVFIAKTLKKQIGRKLDLSVTTYFGEIINNAYDAFIKHSNSLDDLVLKIVIKSDKKNVTIQIADNGPGFSNQQKGVFFHASEFKDEPKDKNLFIGGCGMGLANLSAALAKNEGQLFFKNRKQTGARIYLQMKKAELERTPSNDKHCTIS